MDSKNTALVDLHADRFVPGGAGAVFLDEQLTDSEPSGTYVKWLQNSARFLGLSDKLPMGTKYSSSVTPKVFHTKSTRNLIAEVEKRGGFAEALSLDVEKAATEFMLYQVFTQYTSLNEYNYKCIHHDLEGDRPWTTLQRTNGKTEAGLRKQIQQIKDLVDKDKLPETSMFFGFQNGWYPKNADTSALEKDAIEQLNQLYDKAGLSKDGDTAEMRQFCARNCGGEDGMARCYERLFADM